MPPHPEDVKGKSGVTFLEWWRGSPARRWETDLMSYQDRPSGTLLGVDLGSLRAVRGQQKQDETWQDRDPLE